jgi:glucose-6-phosphate-specific signal transduction histidine kinase
MTTALNLQSLNRSWRAWMGGDKAAAGQGWLGLLWTFVFSAVVAAAFTILGFAAFAQGEGAWRNLKGWVEWYSINLAVALCIGYTVHLLFAISARLMGPARLRALQGLPRTLYFAGIPMLGTAIGWPLGSLLTGYKLIRWPSLSNGNAVAATLLVSLLLSFIFHLIFTAKARQLQAEKRAAEAQLRLLQGQIEPHFLFNTLANVISLIEHDAPKARAMLESFTDYLRSSLASLRHEDATLAGELALAEAYLTLLKTRMEDRLRFTIDADAALRGARLPPLLLQPLVENAIHHGLEPKVEGGQVRIRAWREGTVLLLEVADDGLGLGAPGRRRSGQGMALSNLRERLSARYGDAASLQLSDAAPGTRATLRLPFEILETA